MEKLDCVVIGGGVIGLAAARAFSRDGREVFILEKSEGIGNEASSRNSEVIHAGLYYPTGSLKARLCVSGRDLLYQYCEDRTINYNRIGKLVVASDVDGVPRLRGIEKQASLNGVDDLHWLNRQSAAELEPELDCEAALFSPSTGIIDSHGLMEALLEDAEQMGAIIALGSPVEGGSVGADGILLEIGGPEPFSAMCRTVVNCAGIHASRTAASLKGFPADRVPVIHMCKGNYFSVSVQAPFSHLIYPLPNNTGLGIHLTFDLAGQARIGPDTQWVEEIDYTVDQTRADDFYAAARLYWPDLPDGFLQPGYSGIRAKISGPGEEASDFLLQGPADHGVPGLINLFGIDSPGLTSCMAIADEVVKKVE